MLSFESMAISPATSYRRGQELHHDRRHAQLPAPQLYEEVESRIELQYTVRVSYMEIYNDRIYDLLKGQQGGRPHWQWGAGGRVGRARNVRARPHAGREVARRGRVTLSKLHLLDLAGSERLKKTTIKKESIDINQCLSFLKQCIVALGSKKQRHTPYRQMKLTNVLKDSLGGNSNTLMFACIWGECRHLEETISTLKLAQRMMRVQNEYERQIRELKHELVMHDALVERPAVVYDEHTPEQKHQLLQMVRRYIDAPTQEMEDEALRLTSVNEVRELFRQFKLLFRSSGLDSMGGAASGMNGSGSHGGAGNANASTRSGSAGSSASRTQTSAGSRDDLRMHATHGPTARNWSVKRNLVRLGSLSVSCLVQQDPLRWTRALSWGRRSCRWTWWSESNW
ncbi:hypothetical protein PF005_g24811 [Phytophthora fragariae]|uniref:Kinesin motor domain-containing protein n=1 Tax=Phytophthora fragariae TaxID=53985 RepID=A0A6A3W585_9STRA|nr:hypothetical protein PF005_g24811 [Phytophthora fragariae]